MYKTILVPLDGSKKAEWALPTAINIARATGARVALLNVEIPIPVLAIGMGMLEGGVHGDDRASIPDYLQAVGDRIRTTGVQVLPLGVFSSSAALPSALGAEISEQAQVNHADLIVMTSHARAGIPRLFLGSVARDVVRTSRAPVLLIKPKDEPVTDLTGAHAFMHVLVPLDGSPFSEEILADAVVLGQIGSARYTLVTVVEAPHVVGVPVEPALLPIDEVGLGEMLHEAQTRLDRVATRLRRRWLQVSTKVIVDGTPADRLARIAKELNADLIAMTTHARGGFGSLVLGSVAHDVIRASSVPVLLYRPREA